MADFGINPNIAMGFQGSPANKPMTLNELVGLSRNVMETSRLAELYPELIKKTKAETSSAETGAAKSAMDLRLSKVKEIADGQISMMMNPLVQQAEADPNSVDRNALVNLVTQNAIIQSKNAGMDWETEGKELARPYIEMAQNNPGNLMQFYKERHMKGLDAATRATAFAEGKGIGVSTLPRRSSTGVTSEQMTAPIRGQDLTVAPVTENQVGISAIPGSTAQMAQGPAQGQAQGQAQARMPVGQMVQPETTNYPLMFEPPSRAGIQRPKREGEDSAIKFGEEARNSLTKRQLSMTKSRDDLDQVIRTASKILSEKVLPETGAIGGIKRKFAELTGDPTYQKLQKDIANVQQSNLQALSAGGNSVAGLELNRDAMGNVSYDPEVIVDIARRTKADLTNLDMMANGMNKHFQRYGDANASRYMQMWSANADSKIFQLMDINKDITDPKLRQAAAGKVLEGMSQAQREALDQKYQRILKLTTTGDISQ
jgi:hypothetical protein